jgi:hypothetical protein
MATSLVLCSYTRTRTAGKCSHVLLSGKRRGEHCSNTAHYRDNNGAYHCAVHRRRVKPVDIAFPVDCIGVIASFLQEVDKWPLIFVCKDWNRSVEVRKDTYPLDTYLGVQGESIRFPITSSYSSRLVAWAIAMRLPASQAIVRYSPDPLFLSRLETVIDMGFPVTDESYTRFLEQCSPRERTPKVESIVHKLKARGCKRVDGGFVWTELGFVLYIL